MVINDREHCVESDHEQATSAMAAIIAAKKVQYLGVVVLVGVGGWLALTNPSPVAYRSFATQQTVKLLLRDVCQTDQRRSDTLEKLWGNNCQALAKDGAAEINTFVTHNTQRQNLGVCSLYTTELPFYSLKVLGIANQFVVLSFSLSE